VTNTIAPPFGNQAEPVAPLAGTLGARRTELVTRIQKVDHETYEILRQPRNDPLRL